MFLNLKASVDSMISIESFKDILTKKGVENLSEEEVLKLRDHQDQMAEIFFAMWIEHLNKPKKEV